MANSLAILRDSNLDIVALECDADQDLLGEIVAAYMEGQIDSAEMEEAVWFHIKARDNRRGQGVQI